MSQAWYGMFASVMKHAHDKKAIGYLKKFTAMLRPMANLEGVDYIYRILRYIISTYDVDKQDFVKTVRTNLPFINEDKNMTIIEQCRQEGMQEGIQLGMQKAVTIAEQCRQEGMQEGKLEALETVAIKFLKKGMNYDMVSDFTGLPVIYIKKLNMKEN